MVVPVAGAQFRATKQKQRTAMNLTKTWKQSGIVSVFLLMLACQTNPGPEPGQPAGDEPAEATAVGAPVGTPVQQTIGTGGGSITIPVSATSTETLTVNFPAGALPAPVNIKIQLVENKAPGAIGPAIEISPKDVTLQKPVTITWQYGEAGLNGTGPEAVGIAYQKENGTWAGTGKLTPNDAAKTLTATRPTFDLKYPVAFYQNFYLKYDKENLVPNESVELYVAFQPNHSDALESEFREELLAPLKTWKPVGSDNLDNWRLNGEKPTSANRTWGTLNVHNNGEKALFVAPNRVPQWNPAAISVDLKTGGRSRVMLVANLTIHSPNKLTAGGKTYENAKVTASVSDPDYLFISLTEADPKDPDYPATVFCQIRNFTGPGTYPIDPTWVGPKVTIGGKETGTDGLNYSYGYQTGIEDKFSDGSVTIKEYTGKKGKITGSFSATLYNYNKSKKILKTSSFGGTFQASVN